MSEFNNKRQNSYIVKNALLETGFAREESVNGSFIHATTTALQNVSIENGKITRVWSGDIRAEGSEVVDAKGYLMLPAFKDMHVHLDKTLYGLPWQAVSSRRKTIYDMIAYEQQIIPALLKTSTHRAEQLIGLMQSYGTTFARTHFNIEPTSGFRSLENLQKALENVKDQFDADLVAFPQHGVFYTDSAALLTEAAKLDSVRFIGGVDPYGVDRAIEKVLDLTVGLALDNDKGIDIHLHDSGKEGLDTVEYLIRKVEENPSLKGKTFISHAFVLGRLDAKVLSGVAERLAEARIGIVSSIPFAGLVMPIPVLTRHGVQVFAGNDNIQDHWSTFGSGSMLQKAHLMAQLYGWTSEYDLSRAMKFATGNILPLSDDGVRIWPAAGDLAEFVLMEASCSAETVARISPVKAFVHKGNISWAADL